MAVGLELRHPGAGLTRRRKKARNGEGGIHERKDGRFDAYLTVETVEGKRVARTTKKSRAEATRWLNRQRYRRDRGVVASVDADRITFGEFLDRWLLSIEGTVSRHTFKDYEGKVRLHLKPALGKKKLASLAALDLQSLYALKTADGCSARLVEYVHVTARKALEQAEAWELVGKNVARHAKPPKKKHSERKVLTADQVRAFFAAAAGDRFEALYVLALTTGMRRGELLGLKWADVALDRGSLRVERSLESVYPLTEKAPKREASKRSIELLPEAVAALRSHRLRQLEEKMKAGSRWREHGYVFPTGRGTPMDGDNLRDRCLKPLLRKAGLPAVTFHELRHTFATLELEIGTPAKVVQEVLGHASIVQTLDTYSHRVRSLHTDRAERLREHLFGD